MMNISLNQWILDSIALDVKSAYSSQRDLPGIYDFEARYGDFYVNLLTKIMNLILGDGEQLTNQDYKENLLSLAKGLLTFTNDAISANFKGVVINNAHLYAAVLFYLADYTAIASLILRNCQYEDLITNASRWLHVIISGGRVNSCEELEIITEYLCKGIETRYQFTVDMYNKQIQDFDFETVDDYYDVNLLCKVFDVFNHTNIRADLYKYDNDTLWDNYITYSANQHIYSFLPSQRDALQKGYLSYKRSFALQMPTSAGKSYLTELLIYREIISSPQNKVLYLAPLRSLGHELKEKYANVSKALNFQYRCMYGGSNYTMTESYLNDARLFITTPETFMSLEGAIDELISSFSLVICDEGQLINTPSRGADYELLLTRLKKREDVRFLFISAIIPNIGTINEWLGGQSNQVGDSIYRPCTISLGKVIDIDDQFKLEIYERPYNKPSYGVDGFIMKKNLRRKLNTQKSKNCLIALQSLNAGSVMLYTSAKNGNSGCEAYGNEIISCISQLHRTSPSSYIRPSKVSQLRAIQDYIYYQLGKDFPLCQYLAYGFAIHHADLPQNIRETIELGFSDKILPLVICTSTLAEGVNFPVKTLVLANITRVDENGRMQYMSSDSLLNIIGRAGRAGQERYGMVLVNDDNPFKWSTIIKAANGKNLPQAKGFLSEIINFLLYEESKKRILLTDAEIQELIDSKHVGESIDRMILRSSDVVDINELKIKSVADASLVGYLGNSQSKELLDRIFKVRYKQLADLKNDVQYAKYINCGLNKDELEILQKSPLPPSSITDVNVDQLSTPHWIHWLLSEVNSIAPIDDLELTCRVLYSWMHGKQYVEIANDEEIDIKTILYIVKDFGYEVVVKVRQIIQYWFLRLDIHDSELIDWPILIEMGICSRTQMLMASLGLNDRIALHALDVMAKQLYTPVDDKYSLRNKIRNWQNLQDQLQSFDIPELSKEHIQKFLEKRDQIS